MICLLSLFLIRLAVVYAQGLWCSSSNCSSCLEGYLYRSHKCLALCPSGYSQINKICSKTSFCNFFTFTTGIPLAFDAKNVESFIHPQGLEFRDSGKKSPIMTKDRGLYFDKTSSLVSKISWIISPDFVFGICYKIINPGIIFRMTSGISTILELSETLTIKNFNFLFYLNGINKTEIVSDN